MPVAFLLSSDYNMSSVETTNYVSGPNGGKLYEVCSNGDGGVEAQLTINGLHISIDEHPRISPKLKALWV